jgi:hypothetical protein
MSMKYLIIPFNYIIHQCRVPHMEQELLTLQEQLRPLPILVGFMFSV